MLRLENDPKFTVEVDVMVPADGGHERQSMRVTYSVIPVDELDAFDLGTREGTAEFLRRVVASVSDVQDEKGKELPFNDGLRDALINRTYVRAALLRGYSEHMQAALRGN